MIVVDVLPKERMADVQAFYRARGYLKEINTEDQIVVATLQDAIVGAARIASENDVLVLRGMQIHPDFQRKGIGMRMLLKLNSLIDPTVCWCIPHRWLEDFYGRIGFKQVSEDRAPLFLQERIVEARKTYPQVIMIVKNEVPGR